MQLPAVGGTVTPQLDVETGGFQGQVRGSAAWSLVQLIKGGLLGRVRAGKVYGQATKMARIRAWCARAGGSTAFSGAGTGKGAAGIRLLLGKDRW